MATAIKRAAARAARPSWVALLAAALAAAPGPAAPIAALVAAAAALVLALRAGQAPRAERRVAVAVAALVLPLVAVPFFIPTPTAPDVLAAASRSLEARWRTFLDETRAAVAAPPPAGSDLAWIERRARALGPRAGVALLSADGASAIAWSGWTTPLGDERTALLERLASGEATLVLRRGLALRFLRAARAPGPERLIVVAERPLPTEPAAGFLAAGLPRGARVLVRWEALGEGLRAPFSRAVDVPTGRGPALWSLCPLMTGRVPAALASLGVDGAALAGQRRDALRRALAAALFAAAALVLAAGASFPPASAVVAARVALLALRPALGAWNQLADPAPWAASLSGWPPWLRGLGDTPFDAALSGAALAAVLAILARRGRWDARPGVPRWPFARLAAAIGGAALALLGAALAARLVEAFGLAPAEILIPRGGWLRGALFALALAAPVVAGAIPAVRALFPRLPYALCWGAALGGALAGAAQTAAVPRAARRIAERDFRPALETRRAHWEADLKETLRLAAPPSAPGELVPERDAIDLWWNSPLGRQGLAAGVWKYGPGGALVDSFLSGLPPVQPTPRRDSSGRPSIGPATLRFLGGASRLIVAELPLPDGGAWLAAVLDDPHNLPGRARNFSSYAPLPASAAPRSPYFSPHLAWYDREGWLAASDLGVNPSPPPIPPRVPSWRTASLENGSAQVYDIPDPDGVVSLAFDLPGPLANAALIVDRAAAAALAALLCGAAAALACDPRAARRGLAAFLRRLIRQFRLQVTVFLVGVGLLPLAATGIGGRILAAREISHEVNGAGARDAEVARRLLEDYLTLGGAARTLDDDVARWAARTVGDDLFVWRGGELAATSRPDLVRAGLWPERMDGATWRAIAVSRAPLHVDQRGEDGGAADTAVAHGPFRWREGETAAVSIPLVRAGRRAEQTLAAVDRALLVSAATLVLLAGLLVAAATRRLVSPLTELERAASRIAGGDFAARAPRTGYEETRALGRAFGSMATSLERQRRLLEERRAAIEGLVAALPVAVAAVLPDGRVQLANPRAADLLGAEAGRPLPDAGDPLRAAASRLAAGRSEGDETIEGADSGEPKRFRVSALDLPGLVEGTPTRLVVVEDLTDALRSERLVAWAEMARRIAHEIKNPLTPVSLVVEHVRRLIEERDPDLPRVLDRALATVADQVRVLRDTAREFSDYARLLDVRPEPLDLPRALEEWLAPYSLAPPPGVSVTLDGPRELPEFRGDPRLLRRAVVNLVDNALAAVEGGGAIAVRWSLVETPRRAVRIEVADDGPGIDPALLPRLFETGETTRETGSGLGLPIALQAAVVHGGTIDVDSAPGRGARFALVLPLNGAPPDA
ncbi:HAMP domain-containing protein [bacterium]|nr:HAMP domain-containing protein [bacterium]